MKNFLLSSGMILALSVPAAANEFAPAMQSYLNEEIMSWAMSSEIVASIAAQNAQTAGYDAAMIETLDQQWRAEVGASATPTITPVLSNGAAEFLREQVEAAGGRITEIFIMDAQGLNVAASHVTSDYWQGDEAKFTETFGRGADAIHLGEIEFDESTETYQGQISLTIVDPATRLPIGAMTIGVDAEALM